jgi:putative FmdB family regulatory protein
MPIYEYECGHCHHRFEMKQGFDEEPQAICPQCQGRARRVFHAAPVIFKGSGFYITDSRPSRKDKEPETSKEKSEIGKSQSEAGKNQKGK